MCTHGITKTVRLNKPREVSGKIEVQVDSCISEEIQKLNDKGIWTLGCCCGHGENKKSILIHSLSVLKAEELGYKAKYYSDDVYEI